MTCSIESAIISDAAPAKYRRNIGSRSAGNEAVVALTCLSVELRVVPEDALRVECDAALGAQVSGEARACCHPVVERNQLGVFRLERGHRARKGVAQSLDHLEER